MSTAVANYPWAEELERTVVNSLVTTFGLDFLLFKDKVGGEVDTIHNVRQGVWGTEQEQQTYEQRERYDGTAYHTHPNYIATGRRDKASHQAGQLHDAYRGQTMAKDEQRNLDHVIAAKEIHDDAGRVLAGLDGVELANQGSNLQTTLETINKSKKQSPIDEYLKNLPRLLEGHEKDLTEKQEKLRNLPRDTPEQRHNAEVLEEKIAKTQKKIDGLKSIDAEAMREKDQQARNKYDRAIDRAYYGGSKFMLQTGFAAGLSGFKMGTRQMLGLVMAELWFELRLQVPRILDTLKKEFSFEKFVDHVRSTFRGIWRRIRLRFKDFLTDFKDGVFGGVMSSLMTTIFNIFATTQKATIKIIREIWGQLCKAFKLIFFNPEKLGFTDLCKAVMGVLSAAAGVTVGSIAHAQLLPLCNFPFGAELASFVSALVAGLATLGFTYVLLHSNVAQRAWAYLESMMPHADTVKKYQAINAELDGYLTELARLEFDMDTEQLAAFSRDLSACNDEMQRGLVLKDEIAKQGIELPYEMGNTASTRKWLASLAK
ncbi:hypothetical protein [Cupriavidus consociatus]|uniref:hypothetical protein n=1 Tax=Cupriavidus consociatus TaxID=2821357 RepID=UPI001AE8485E|nr:MULTISPECIES: hypothetical protein [unclassified Cupriavidus]MBP0622906.1 hypothetical protein [Cupriavidus sp. LEh25]MDK2659594.1 hypothetical protein [Cupriavidus sp. LEh21]